MGATADKKEVQETEHKVEGGEDPQPEASAASMSAKEVAPPRATAPIKSLSAIPVATRSDGLGTIPGVGQALGSSLVMWMRHFQGAQGPRISLLGRAGLPGPPQSPWGFGVRQHRSPRPLHPRNHPPSLPRADYLDVDDIRNQLQMYDSPFCATDNAGAGFGEWHGLQGRVGGGVPADALGPPPPAYATALHDSPAPHFPVQWVTRTWSRPAS